MRFGRIIHRALSEGQGVQLVLLLALVATVLAVLLLIGCLFGDMSWQTILAIYLDPGIWGGEGSHDWFRILIAVLGIFLFSGLLVSLFISIVVNVTAAFKHGENRYRFEDHILIIGSAKPLVNMLSSIRSHPELSQKDILIMTSAEIPQVQSHIQSALSDRSFCRSISYYHRDRETKVHLEEACAGQARIIYIIGEDGEAGHDSLNLKCLGYLKEICTCPGPVIQCFVTVSMHSALDVVHYMKGEDDESRLCVDMVSKSDYIVEQVLVHADTLPALTAEDKGKRVRIVVVGDSSIGRSFAAVASQICHYPNFEPGTRTQITFIDKHMQGVMDRQQANHPGLFDLCHHHYIAPDRQMSFAPKTEYGDFMDLEWTFVDADPSSPFARDLLVQWAGDPREELLIAVCYEDDAKSLSTAFHFPRQVYASGCSILVYQEHNSVLVDEARATGMFGNIQVFGEGLPDVDTLYLKRTTYGKRINRVYDLEYGNPPASDVETAWKRLSQAHKMSSIASANFMPMLLRCFRLEPVEEVFSAIPAAILEQISEVEHRRWMASVLMLGYSPATIEGRKDRSRFKYLKNEEFIHLDITPYDDLAHEQEKDRLIVSNIPYVLGEVEHPA